MDSDIERRRVRVEGTSWKIGALVLGVLLAILQGTTSQSAEVVSTVENATPGKTITFVVGSSVTSTMMAGVEVLLVAKDDQIVTLGHTDKSGEFTVPKDELQVAGAKAVLFCKERFFCGAFRLDDPEFFAYDEMLIHLAGFAVL